MKRKLLKTGLLAAFAAAALSMGAVLTGATLDLGSTTYSLDSYAPHVGLTALVGLALLGGRFDPDAYETWEIGAAVASIGLVGVIYLGEPASIVTMIETDYHPWSGVAAAAVSFVGAYALGRGS